MGFGVDLLLMCISICILLQHNTNGNILQKDLQNLKFSWGNCGPATDPIKIISLSIGPDPIRLPGNVVVSTSINVTKPFPADVNAKVNMEKNVFGIWINVPCDHGVGSCSYNVCTNKTNIYSTLIDNYTTYKTCPKIPPAIYSVENFVVDVSKSIPSIAEGDFRIDINFDSNYAGHLACLHLGVTLKD